MLVIEPGTKKTLKQFKPECSLQTSFDDAASAAQSPNYLGLLTFANILPAL